MMRRRLLAVAVTLALAAAAGAVGLVRKDEAERQRRAAQTVTVLHWNICGAAQNCANRGATHEGSSVARLAGEAAHRRPDLLTVNEVCRAQYEELELLLALKGWRMSGAYAQMHDNVPACGGDSSYGLAVFSRQPLTGPVQYRPFTATGDEEYEAQGRVEPVRRGVLCAPTTARGRQLVLCGAHGGTEPGQMAQAHEWFADTTAFPAQLPVVFAGDLNQQPNEASMAGIYAHTRGEKDPGEPTGRFTEADETDKAWFRLGAAGGVRCDPKQVSRCRNGAPTAADGRKIDYIFATEEHFTAPAARTTRFPESDHELYQGTFRFRQ
ncbi:endonuclease/exonuclease/phosphatase family protein [Streptomyces antimicrobicus]|uniref:Endonuclease/exonuclease/phosphatase family protein n=1 Tax=Streptomyces antimicrobicus TaxID=2883108 RepID=A0ABS8B0A3_9ACTN|nr:endonuclease/exonuclease/phosphatase family protein [Streptomyces antimicrobicus]MCB5178000.1 endonuclease/exonuclease/phosphatase family protein [Streptomyces antimicrobicus]